MFVTGGCAVTFNLNTDEYQFAPNFKEVENQQGEDFIVTARDRRGRSIEPVF